MRQIYLLLLGLMFFACSKESPEPDLSAEVKGTYLAYDVIIDSKEYPFPFTGADFLLELIPQSTSTCILRTSSIFPGISDTGEIVVTLIKNGNATELLKGKQKVGLVTGQVLEFYFVDNNGKDVTIKGRKM